MRAPRRAWTPLPSRPHQPPPLHRRSPSPPSPGCCSHRQATARGTQRARHACHRRAGLAPGHADPITTPPTAADIPTPPSCAMPTSPSEPNAAEAVRQPNPSVSTSDPRRKETVGRGSSIAEEPKAGSTLPARRERLSSDQAQTCLSELTSAHCPPWELLAEVAGSLCTSCDPN